MKTTREQLNTDLLINLNSAMAINNTLILASATISRADKRAVEAGIADLAYACGKLSDKSRILDKQENIDEQLPR